MVTKTIYSDAHEVVVDIGQVDDEREWLQETTYLLNSAGQTTAMIAQTGPLSSGQTALPVPFTPADAQILATAAASSGISSPSGSPTASNAATPSTPSKSTGSPPTIIIAMGVIGGIFGLLFSLSMYLLFQRRGRKSWVRKKSENVGTEDEWGIQPRLSPNRLETGTKKLQDSPTSSEETDKSGVTSSEKPTWDGFMKEVEEEYNRFDESKISSTEGYNSRQGGSVNGGYYETASVQEERLYRSRQQNHSPPPSSMEWRSRQTLSRAEVSSLPPLPRQTMGEVQEINEGGDLKPMSGPEQAMIGSVMPRTAAKLASILKRPTVPSEVSMEPVIAPAPGPKGWLETVQSMFGKAEGYKPTFAESRPKAKQKKGVRFGEDEVREFERTPAPSRTASPSSSRHTEESND
ncbi:hypothetical protein MMC12_008306 [Toensbergia leucococca]|nr:hypothetical protein [Toensbergia leucococca]